MNFDGMEFLEINFNYQDILLSNTNITKVPFDLLDGVTLKFSDDIIDNKYIQVTSEPEFKSNVNGDYVVTYTAVYKEYNITEKRNIKVVNPTIQNYNYTGSEQKINIKENGLYKVELWGASGGDIDNHSGGNGAYTSGNIELETTDNLYAYVGNKGNNDTYTETCFNGGGKILDGQIVYGRDGGGATDIRLKNGSWDNFDSLKSRIMVAAGGGAANDRNGPNNMYINSHIYGEGPGGAGGTLTGIDGTSVNNSMTGKITWGYNYGTGGTQISGGLTKYSPNHTEVSLSEAKSGSFGKSQDNNQTGGGGGYYGGGSSGHSGAGGGSSFVSGYTGCNAVAESSTSSNIIHTNQAIHYSNKKFEMPVMISGNATMPSYNGESILGNDNNGYAKIMPIIIPLPDTMIGFDKKNINLSNTNITKVPFDLLDGVTLKVKNKKLDNRTIEITSEPEFKSNVNGDYVVTYTAVYKEYNITEKRNIKVVNPTIQNYNYTGSEQKINIKENGLYKVELWGASGGDIDNHSGGNGAYTSGNIELETTDNLYAYVGNKGNNDTYTETCFNGGGKILDGQIVYGRDGGGATDIRLKNGSWDNFDSLKSRIMVAAGGGAANDRNGPNNMYINSHIYGEGPGGAGGTLTGIDGTSVNNSMTGKITWGYNYGTGGTQISGGLTKYSPNHTEVSLSEAKSGSFGKSQDNNQTGGGGGYYGGGSSGHSGAGGGSSFVSGYTGCNAVAESSTSSNIIHTNQAIHYSNKKFEMPVMISGNATMPSYNGESILGNDNNGYAKIMPIIIQK